MNQYNILRFDISVKYFLLMNVIDRIQKVSNNKWGSFFWKSLTILDDIIELSTFTQFENRIEIILIVEKSENSSNVGVLQVILDLKLPNKLSQEVLLYHSFLLDCF